MDPARLRAAYEQVKRELLAERTPDGHWVGELSSSALATATAVSALAVVRRAQSPKSQVQSPKSDAASTLDLGPGTLDSLISRGVAYLVTQQNPDGGFGDTDLSHSNIATTYLVVAALHLAGVSDDHSALLARANAYIDSKGRLAGLRERYGIDKTFVVPIMTNLALAGLLDWRAIDPLPFELACVPQSWYRFVGMPVVSYAIPALVAIGQARYHHAPPRNPITRLVRWLSITRSLKVLRRMQPDSGGYLEAAPLTSFVVMSLASIHSSPHAPREDRITRSVMTTMDDVIREGVKFLAASNRPDGSWPIDTNLATWNTTLAINALAGAGEDVAELLLPPVKAAGAVGNALRGVPGSATDDDPAADSGRGASGACVPTQSVGTSVLDWLLSCQHTKRHPFTGADPGGFGWSDLSGAVPDADDTPGVLLALSTFHHSADDPDQLPFAIHYAASWLIGLQNRDRGWPTFCRGWGKLPFDRSGTDLTAHVVRSLVSSREAVSTWEQLSDRSLINYEEGLEPRSCPVSRVENAISSGLEFNRRRQHPDGSWSPLWFGNQDHSQEDNPVYGTAKVLMAYRDLGLMDSPEARRGVAWLVANQNADGGWGSGVWGKVRSAECGVRNEGTAVTAKPLAAAGVESGRGVTGLGEVGRSAMSTAYSVPSTQYSEPEATRRTTNDVHGGLPQGADAPRSPMDATRSPFSPQSEIRNPQLVSSVEETALAVEALLAACQRNTTEGVPYSALNPEPRTRNPEPRNATEGFPYSAIDAPLEKGLTWLALRVERGEHRQPAPIGFYFAKLWYYERLYPLTFTVAALGRACRQFDRRPSADLADSATPASTGTTPWTTAAP